MGNKKKPTRLVFGIETELATSFIKGVRKRSVQDQEDHLRWIIHYIADRYPSIADSEWGAAGYYFPGGRIYLDSMGHLEAATCECSTPDELVKYNASLILAVAEGMSQLEKKKKVSGVLSLCNTDYVGDKWSLHENYTVRRREIPGDYREALLLFLTTRMIYGGAGGLISDRAGVGFSLAPVSHFCDPELEEMFFIKEDTDNGRLHRLHIRFQEALCSQFGLRLRIGVTALVVMLLERGINPAVGMEVVAPARALRIVAEDFAFKRPILTRRGLISALDVQQHFLEAVKQHWDYLPPWAEGIVSDWQWVLDTLASDPTKLEAYLDWPLKFRLFQEMAQSRHGIAWDDIGRITQGDTALLRLKNDLVEADFLYSKPEDGYHALLEQAGQLSHRLPGMDDDAIRDAIAQPPVGSRAELRGRFILDHPFDSKRYRMTWGGITDTQEDRHIELRSPFATKLPDWKPLPTFSDYTDYSDHDLGILLDDILPDLSPVVTEGNPLLPTLDHVFMMDATEANMTMLHDRGVSSERRGMTSMASRYYAHAMAMAERIGNASMVTHCRWHLASVWLHENRREEAMEIIKPILERADDDPEPDFDIHLQSSLLIALQATVANDDAPWNTIQQLYERGMSLNTRHNDTIRPRLTESFQSAILRRAR
jgi:Pup amidohydrolase